MFDIFFQFLFFGYDSSRTRFVIFGNVVRGVTTCIHYITCKVVEANEFAIKQHVYSVLLEND